MKNNQSPSIPPFPGRVSIRPRIVSVTVDVPALAASLSVLLASLLVPLEAAAAEPVDGSMVAQTFLTLESPNQVSSGAGQFQFRMQGSPNAIYSIEVSDDLLHWEPLATYQTPDSGSINLVDLDAVDRHRRFYRVALPPSTSILGVNVPRASAVNGLYPLSSPKVKTGPDLNPLAALLRLDRILVKPKPGIALGALGPLQASVQGRVVRVFPELGNLHVLELPLGANLKSTLSVIQLSGLVAYAEPDYLVRVLAEPNDFRFKDGSLWNLHNVGQNGGKPDADIDAPEGWDIRSSASDVVVAVIDTGMRYTHEDLAANAWVNKKEIPGNGVDDDQNGFVDDVHGINAILNNGDPMDDHGHGSHVSGIIGAVGNNETGIVGVAWKVQLMACKFINAQGDGAVSDAITCLDYARKNGAKIINGSWGGPSFNSQALRDAVESARNAGIIFVAAAGNSASDNEVPDNAVYPASFDLDNIISVLATTRNDELAFFSSYGAKTVDIGAPGLDVFSCWNASDSDYKFFIGSSMAAAHVSGACALAVSSFPGDNYRQIINRILAGADPVPSLAGKCVTGGRLNLQNVIGSAPRQTTVSVVASDTQAAEAGLDPGKFTITRSGSTASALTVNFTLGGTAVNGTDYKQIDTSLTIPAGEISATLSVTPIDDTALEEKESVILTLGENSAYVIGSPNNATVTIADNDSQLPPKLPAVTVKATDDKAAEKGADPGEFTVSRTGETTAVLVVKFTLTGTATNGADYKTLETSLTIPEGAASATLAVTPIDDAAVEGNETVILTLAEDATYTIGSPNAATVNIEDNDAAPPTSPLVTVKASDESAAEKGLDPGEFTFSRTGETTAALTVKFVLTGTAANGADYKTLETSVTIPEGAASAMLAVTPIDDAAVEGNETVILTLAEDASYTIGSPNAATVNIEDNDAAPPTSPLVTVKASDESAAEKGLDPGEFTFSRTGETTAALTVKFVLTGTAANGADYKTLETSLTIPAGAASAALAVTPLDDAAAENKETVILTLAEDAAYTIGSPNTATVAIEDDDAPPPPPTPLEVSVKATDANASENGREAGEFTFSRTGETTTALTVKFTLAGTADNGADYKTLETSIVIPAGAASATLAVAPIDDAAVENKETVILTLAEDAAYTIGSPNTATVEIEDNDAPPPPPARPTVAVKASDASASENGPDSGEFTFSRTGETSAALTVKYTLTGTASNGADYQTIENSVTIPAGAASTTLAVTPIDDAAVEGNETVILTLADDAAYVIGSPNTATVSIQDNDSPPAAPPTVSVGISVSLFSEGDRNGGYFAITRSGGNTSSPLTVRFTLGGSATNGTDYQRVSDSATIPAGATSVKVPIVPIDDSIVELLETVTLTLKQDPAYQVDPLGLGIMAITDNDLGLGGILNLGL